MGLFTSIILFMKDISTILNVSRLYKFVIKSRLLLASERLPSKHSKAHNLTHVLSLLRLFTKKFKKRRCNCPLTSIFLQMRWSRLLWILYGRPSRRRIQYIYAKWYKTWDTIDSVGDNIGIIMLQYTMSTALSFNSLTVCTQCRWESETWLKFKIVPDLNILMMTCNTWQDNRNFEDNLT